MSDLVIRPLVAGEEELFDSLPDPKLVGFAAFGREYRAMAAAGEYRPEWTWVALRDGVVVARAAWWGGPEDAAPLALDWFDIAPGESDAGTELLATSPLRAEYCLGLPPGWRDRPDVRAAAEIRLDAAQAAGLRPLVERYKYEWTPECGLPERPGRLRFRPEPNDNTFLGVLRQVQHGTLDAHARHAIDANGGGDAGIEAAAVEDLDILRWFPSPREWWRLAYTADGTLVGLTVPARNYTNPVVGLIGVVPEQRGRGYAYDLLVECTHMLAEEGVDRIVAATDVGNAPMAATFARAGYPVTEERIFLLPQE